MNRIFREILANGRSVNRISASWPKSHFCSAVSSSPALQHDRTYATTFGQKTLALQDSLEKLPVPDLKDTASMFLLTAQPHLDEKEFETTKKRMMSLLEPGSLGEKLQNLLLKKRENTENWLSDWWMDTYLSFRDPVIVNSSPGISFPPRVFKNLEQQLEYAAKVVKAALDFKTLLDKQMLAPEVSGDKPLDMITFYRLYGTTRIPRPKTDYLSFHPNSKHIIVAHDKNFYRLDVADVYGQWMNYEQLFEALEQVVQDSKDRGPGHCIGVLTAGDRDNWAKGFETLIQENKNRDIVDQIEKSLFLLCIDGDHSHLKDFDRRTRNALQALHGLDSFENRWHDKTLQFYVGESGENGMIQEHSPSDTITVMRLVDHIMGFINEDIKIGDAPATVDHHPKYLDFVMSDNIYGYIHKAKKSANKLIDDIEMKVLKYDAYGKNQIKEFKMSPDSYVQMALQYTFYKLHQEPVATYESAATRFFKEGRTDVIRSCTQDSVAFAKKMVESSVSDSEKYNYFLKAVKAHNNIARQAANGRGVDRHLLGLKKIALENNLQLPDIFEDPGYLRSTRMRLSTSQISNNYGCCVCYGPLVPDGYSCAYDIEELFLQFAVGSLRSCKDTNANKFSSALEENLDELRSICQTHTC